MNDTIKVNGWNLTVRDEDSEQRILDVELGERLGYTEPSRDIHRVIEGLVKDGELPDVLYADRTVGISKPNGGIEERTVQAYYLTEREALQVIAKSRTKTAHKITNEIIDVYLVVKHGSDTDVAQLRLQLSHQEHRLDTIERQNLVLIDRIVELDNPLVLRREADQIRARIRAIAQTRNADYALLPVVACTRVDNELRGRAGYPRASGRGWHALPRQRLGNVLSELMAMEAEEVSLARSKSRHAAKKIHQLSFAPKRTR